MSPRSVSDPLVRETDVLSTADPVGEAVRRVLAAELPALPVADSRGRFSGIFGEREFFAALFPRYLGELSHAGFVPKSVEAALEKRSACRHEPVGDHMNTDHVAVETDFSDAQVAEIFLHHRVLIVPVVDAGPVVGVITRADFFRALAERFLAAGG
jgi:CBS-domain-containing membrane protein